MSDATEPRQRSITSWGRLYTQDELLVANIACILYFAAPEAPQPESWWGALRAVRIYRPLGPGSYRLRLTSGWTGYILLTEASFQGEGRYLFQGEGPLTETNPQT